MSAPIDSTSTDSAIIKQLSNLSLLPINTENNYNYEALVHDIIDEICGRGPGLRQLNRKLDFDASSDSESQEQHNPLTLIRYVSQSVKKIIEAMFAQNIALEELKAFVIQQGQIEEEKLADLVCRCVAARYSELQQTFKTKYSIEQISSAYLRDFDWKMQLTIASDRASQLNDPSVLLKLYLESNDTNESKRLPKEVLLELTKERLDSLLRDFARIEQVLQTVTTLQ